VQLEWRRHADCCATDRRLMGGGRKHRHRARRADDRRRREDAQGVRADRQSGAVERRPHDVSPEHLQGPGRRQMSGVSRAMSLTAVLIGAASFAAAQPPPPPPSPAPPPAGPPPTPVQPQAPAPPPQTITLQDALARAKQNDVQFQSAVADAEVAREDRVQARAALLPNVSYTTQYLGNSPNGVNPNGRFVSLDGVKMYRAWGVVRQDVSPNLFTLSPLRRARGLEAAAAAKVQA